ncbi:MAG: hypothetical protein ACYDEX_22010 [Mobilitalea sp.]
MKKLFITTIVLFALTSCGKDVELKNQNWSCESGTCKVEFSLKNNKDHGAIRKVRIIAYNQTDVGKGAIAHNIVGEKIFYTELRAGEQKNYTENIIFYSYLKPNMVVISHSAGER